ncbi:MAG: hypothetical protein KGI13_02230 [Betaproteobacteria bacterium]|nr:hypothetical protein [Betaproteobacteria bacterium]
MVIPYIDIKFCFLDDTPIGKDPDSYSPTLRRYHKYLWSKSLPSGKIFILDDTMQDNYLYHKSDLGEFIFSSDSAIHTFTKLSSMAWIINKLEDGEAESFRRLSYTIGGMIIFPSNRVDGKATINGARGMHPKIKDRIDLTLECIRRHYSKDISPLSDVMGRYSDFFALFNNFRGYIEFFLLQDLVNSDFSAINFLAPFNDFQTSPLPRTLDEYQAYKAKTINFVNSRNKRIQDVS